MRNRPKNIQRIQPSEADKLVGVTLTSYATHERIKRMLSKLLLTDLVTLRGEITDEIAKREQEHKP